MPKPPAAHGRIQSRSLLLVALLLVGALGLSAYKSKPWTIRPAESYPSRLTSEKVTIAVDPLFLDSLAGQVFDRKDVVTRGVLPVAIAVFNENEFPVEIDGESIELIMGDEKLRSLEPGEVVGRLFQQKGGRKVWIPNPIPKIPSAVGPDTEAFEDLEHKYFASKIVAPRAKGGGFLYFPVRNPNDLRKALEDSRLNIPDLYRQDTGDRLLYFEIELRQAIAAAPKK